MKFPVSWSGKEYSVPSTSTSSRARLSFIPIPICCTLTSCIWEYVVKHYIVIELHVVVQRIYFGLGYLHTSLVITPPGLGIGPKYLSAGTQNLPDLLEKHCPHPLPKSRI